VAYPGPIRRWDVFRADLEPAVGREQGGKPRPVVVVSNDGCNAHFDVVTIVPLTKLEGKRREAYTFEVKIPRGVVDDRFGSIVMPQQIRTVSRLRLLDRLGTVADRELREEIEDRILEHLGIDFEPYRADS
jgi:mRNA interferase MazF